MAWAWKAYPLLLYVRLGSHQVWTADLVQDMGAFSQRCNRAGTLSRLRSITLTVDEHTSLAQWQQHVLDLLSNAPLQRFHISTVGGHVGHRLSDDFCKAIVTAHGHRLTRFSVHRMRMSIDAIADICRRCTALQQLFIVVEQNDLVRPSLVAPPRIDRVDLTLRLRRTHLDPAWHRHLYSARSTSTGPLISDRRTSQNSPTTRFCPSPASVGPQ